MITRFAPSPTGYLHRGHALAAREAFGFATTQGGTCLLRIEDIDHTRCRPDYSAAMVEDLRWLGFDWPEPIRVQSAHFEDYAKAVITLLQQGLVYPCALSRSDLSFGLRTDPASVAHSAVMEATERLQAAKRLKNPSLPYALRLNLGRALRRVASNLPYCDNGEEIFARTPLQDWVESARPDPVLARRDIATSYHIAVTHDDHLQAVTHVVRGQDLQAETPLHILLQTLMGWPTPDYIHHPLLLGLDGKKLSKTAKSETIRSLRAAGQTAEAVPSHDA